MAERRYKVKLCCGHENVYRGDNTTAPPRRFEVLGCDRCQTDDDV